MILPLFRLRQGFVIILLVVLEYSTYGDDVDETLSAVVSKSPPLLVFGILSQPFYDDKSDTYSDRYYDNNDYNDTYIAASYVKWLEDGGARSIPIPFDASPSLVEDILSQVDGVLFPGGGSSSLPSSVITIWNKLHSDKYYYPNEDNNNKNDDNDDDDNASADMVPLWGTCLGMEFIVQLAAATATTTVTTTTDRDYDCNFNHNCNDKYAIDRNILEMGYDSTNISLPLLEVQRTGLYSPKNVYETVTGYNVTMNNHHLGISPQRFQKNFGLSQRFDITSINYDRNGKEFVSTIEPTTRASSTTRLSSSPSSPRLHPPPPVYGVQYHPEKNSHEYGLYPGTDIPYEAIDHSPEGIAFSLYEARFLVELARRNVLNKRKHDNGNGNGNGNGNDNDANKYTKPDLYPMVYTYPRRVGYKFEERYIIPPASHWEKEMNDDNYNDNDNRNKDKEKNLANEKVETTKSFFRHRS